MVGSLYDPDLARLRGPVLGVLLRHSQNGFDLRDSVLQALLWRELPLERLLSDHRFNCEIDPDDLLVAGYDFPNRARLAGVEKNEVLDDVEQPLLRQHAVQQVL